MFEDTQGELQGFWGNVYDCVFAHFAGLGDEVVVFVGDEAVIWDAALSCTDEVAGAAEFEVVLGDDEAVAFVADGSQSFSGECG